MTNYIINWKSIAKRFDVIDLRYGDVFCYWRDICKTKSSVLII